MDDYHVSDNDALEGRKQEMERDILPGFMTKFTLPNSGRVVDVYSRSYEKEEENGKNNIK